MKRRNRRISRSVKALLFLLGLEVVVVILGCDFRAEFVSAHFNSQLPSAKNACPQNTSRRTPSLETAPAATTRRVNRATAFFYCVFTPHYELKSRKNLRMPSVAHGIAATSAPTAQTAPRSGVRSFSSGLTRGASRGAGALAPALAMLLSIALSLLTQ